MTTTAQANCGAQQYVITLIWQNSQRQHGINYAKACDQILPRDNTWAVESFVPYNGAGRFDQINAPNNCAPNTSWSRCILETPGVANQLKKRLGTFLYARNSEKTHYEQWIDKILLHGSCICPDLADTPAAYLQRVHEEREKIMQMLRVMPGPTNDQLYEEGAMLAWVDSIFGKNRCELLYQSLDISTGKPVSMLRGMRIVGSFKNNLPAATLLRGRNKGRLIYFPSELLSWAVIQKHINYLVDLTHNQTKSRRLSPDAAPFVPNSGHRRAEPTFDPAEDNQWASGCDAVYEQDADLCPHRHETGSSGWDTIDNHRQAEPTFEPAENNQWESGCDAVYEQDPDLFPHRHEAGSSSWDSIDSPFSRLQRALDPAENDEWFAAVHEQDPGCMQRFAPRPSGWTPGL